MYYVFEIKRFEFFTPRNSIVNGKVKETVKRMSAIHGDFLVSFLP